MTTPRGTPRFVAATTAAALVFAPAVSAFLPATPRGFVGGGGGGSAFFASPGQRKIAVFAKDVEDNGNGSEDGTVVQEYRNAVTSLLSNFMQKTPEMDAEKDESVGEEGGSGTVSLDSIDWDAPKFDAEKVGLETLASILDYELTEKEWFVTGNVNPVYFADDFKFQDPDVKVDGIRDYAKGVRKLFDQQTSRAEIISTLVSDSSPNTITVTWRLSGKVNIGPGLTIKPYICYTDLTVDESTGLIVFQEDRFDIPGWDILLSTLFPFLAGNVLAAPTPDVEVREVPKPTALVEWEASGGKVSDTDGSSSSPVDRILSFFGN